MPEDDPEGRVQRPDPAIGDLLSQVMRRLARRGRDSLRGAADTGRSRLELRQLQRDRDSFWIRLGKTAYRLQESGELDHPAIEKAMRRIDEIEQRIRDLEAGAPERG
jgi:hypothetical protein